MGNENMDMTTADTVTPTAAEDAAIQKEPPALVKKNGTDRPAAPGGFTAASWFPSAG